MCITYSHSLLGKISEHTIAWPPLLKVVINRGRIKYGVVAMMEMHGLCGISVILSGWYMLSVLWHCWLGDRKGIWPVKCSVSVCWPLNRGVRGRQVSCWMMSVWVQWCDCYVVMSYLSAAMLTRTWHPRLGARGYRPTPSLTSNNKLPKMRCKLETMLR